MRLTLRTATKAALKEYGRLPREQWALQHPGQLVTLVSNIFWCQVSHHGCCVDSKMHLLVSATVYLAERCVLISPAPSGLCIDRVSLKLGLLKVCISSQAIAAAKFAADDRPWPAMPLQSVELALGSDQPPQELQDLHKSCALQLVAMTSTVRGRLADLERQVGPVNLVPSLQLTNDACRGLPSWF